MKKATADCILDRQDDQEVRVNIPWKQNLTPEETKKSADELSQRFEAHGVTKDKTVVVHCQIGKAAAHSYITLRPRRVLPPEAGTEGTSPAYEHRWRLSGNRCTSPIRIPGRGQELPHDTSASRVRALTSRSGKSQRLVALCLSR